MSNGVDLDMAATYVRENFRPEDRLAIVLINRRAASVMQRLSSARALAHADTLNWLAEKNRHGFDVYVSMNALRASATGRTKADVAQVRHIYLDFDFRGTEHLKRLLEEPGIPPPNIVVSTSPEKWQVVWNVEGFEKRQAEALQKMLASRHGADPAATDCARVFRLPGYYNTKYRTPHLISAERRTAQIYRPEDFPAPSPNPAQRFATSARSITGHPEERRDSQSFPRSQSEKDWAYALRALARGVSPELVAAAISQYRQHDKQDPRYYAELTVRKAAQTLGVEPGSSPEPDRT